MKINVIKKSQSFEVVEIREPTIADLGKILKISKGIGIEIDLEDIAGTLSRITPVALHFLATFDGAKLQIEEIQELPASFLLDAFKVLFPGDTVSSLPHPNA